MKVKPGTAVRKKQCETCVFRDPKDGGIELAPGRHDEIKLYLLQGQNQFCHHDDNKTICRGSRDYQLQCFASMGFISDATDDALRAAMTERGITPASHI